MKRKKLFIDVKNPAKEQIAQLIRAFKEAKSVKDNKK